MKPPLFLGKQLPIKICGLKTAKDAQSAIDLGADALGFNFYPSSKRFISLETALEVVSKLSPPTPYVAVVVNSSADEVSSLRTSGIFAAIQFHGDESPEFCAASGFSTWIKAVRIRNFDQAEQEIRSFQTPYILLDTDAGKAYGGTGVPLDLSLAARIVQAFPDKKFLLAGGLRPENVRKAIEEVRPFALDVASGVEDEPGRKSLSKMRAFIAVAR